MHILDEFLQNVTINLFDYDICRLFSSLCTKEVHTYKEKTYRGTEINCFYKLQQVRQAPYLSALYFWHSLVWNFQFDKLNFFPSLNLIFTAFSLQKTSSNLEKIQFIKLESLNSIMSQINWKQIGGYAKSFVICSYSV